MTSDAVIAGAAVTAAVAARGGAARPGTVVGLHGASVIVDLDGDVEVFAERLTPGPVRIGDRVMVRTEPPHGAFVTASTGMATADDLYFDDQFPATALNALTRTLGTLTIPAQGFPYRTFVEAQVYVGASVQSDLWELQLYRDPSMLLRTVVGSGSGTLVAGRAWTDAGDESITLSARLARTAGTGAAQTYLAASTNVLTGRVVPM